MSARVADACSWQARLICSTAAITWPAALESSWMVADSCSADEPICSAAEAPPFPVTQLFGQRCKRLRRDSGLLERLGLLLDSRLRLGRAGRLFFGGARDLLGALFGFDGRAFGLHRRRQDCPAVLGDLAHVFASRFERLDDDQPRPLLHSRQSPPLSSAPLQLRSHRSGSIRRAAAPPARSCPSFRQRSHFVGDHGKTAAVFACARRFDRGIQRQQIGLIGNPAHRLGDSPISFARRSSSAMTVTDARWRSALRSIARTDAAI